MVENGLVPAIQCGFPVTASSVLPGEHTADRAAYNFNCGGRGASTWCAALND